jgi:glutamine cyclotransferase
MRKSPSFLLTFLLTFFLSCFLISCTDSGNSPDNDGSNDIKPVPAISYSILSTVPHDTSYFTEGLEFYQNTLMESTGLNGKSKLVQTDPKTGKVIKEINLDNQYFGEGITILNDTIYQLTWQEHVVFVYTAKDFKKVKELPLNGQGWGLTNDGKQLIASNGSSDLLFYEPQTFKLLKTVTVTERGSVVPNINELEYVNGFVYANIWQQNYIYKIDPTSGEVVGKMDLSDIVSRARQQYVNAEVLNGIAYNPATQKFYVTGKNWPVMYEVSFGQ